jgi:hypothetical protein
MNSCGRDNVIFLVGMAVMFVEEAFSSPTIRGDNLRGMRSCDSIKIGAQVPLAWTRI